jgi:hypothetical protein
MRDKTKNKENKNVDFETCSQNEKNKYVSNLIARIKIDDLIISQTINLLEKMGIEYIISPFEA